MNRALLLVEDEEHLAFTLHFNLIAEGYEVDVAPSIEGARSCLEGRSYDALLLDVMLPDGDGIEFCRDLRAGGERAPILMLTALGTTEDIVRGLDAGADDYVPKPFQLPELIGRLDSLMRRLNWDRQLAAEPIEGGQRRFGRGHLVDLDRGKVYVDGQPLTLTDLEFELLAFFVRHPNEVVTRERLLEEVWRLPGTTNTRTVDNFLVRLRRMFEADPAHPEHFMTVRGSGYRFRP